jgi:hypothetical protein
VAGISLPLLIPERRINMVLLRAFPVISRESQDGQIKQLPGATNSP